MIRAVRSLALVLTLACAAAPLQHQPALAAAPPVEAVDAVGITVGDIPGEQIARKRYQTATAGLSAAMARR